MKPLKTLPLQPRREFLKNLGLLSAGFLLPAYGNASMLWSDKPVKITPIRIRGKVSAQGKGIKGVAVTDGYSVVTTDASGVYELMSSSLQEFVYISLPGGYQVPTRQNGIASFFSLFLLQQKENSRLILR